MYRTKLFNRNGTMLQTPQVNVTQYVAPPLIDYVLERLRAEREASPTVGRTAHDHRP